MSPDIFLGEGATGPTQQYTILDGNGNRVSVAGATVVFRYRDKDQIGVEIDEPVVVTETSDPTTFGDVEWTPAGPMPVGGAGGDYNGNFVTIFGDGTEIPYPDDRYLWMQILPKP
jgi:hypothetical protein